MSGGIQMHAIFMTRQLSKAFASVINTWKAVSVSSPGVGSIARPYAVWTHSFWSPYGQRTKMFWRNYLRHGYCILSRRYISEVKWKHNHSRKIPVLQTKDTNLMTTGSDVELWDSFPRGGYSNTRQVGYTLSDIEHLLSIKLEGMCFQHVIWLKVSKSKRGSCSQRTFR